MYLVTGKGNSKKKRWRVALCQEERDGAQGSMGLKKGKGNSKEIHHSRTLGHALMSA
ncbi:unnamed protein product [Camellia sinensis]